MILINDRPLSDYATETLSLTGYADSVQPVRSVVAVANTGGGVPGTGTTAKAPDLVLTCGLRGTSMTNRHTLRERLVQAFRGTVELQLPNELPGRVLRVQLAGQPVVEFWNPSAPFAHPGYDLRIPLTRVDGCWFDKHPIVLALGATPVACPVGALPSAPRIEFFGATTPVVDPAVTLRNGGGQSVTTVAVAGSLGSTAYTALDVSRGGRVTRVAAGVQSLDALALGADVTALPILDPGDALPELGRWPLVSLASASGTPTGRIIYRRGW